MKLVTRILAYLSIFLQCGALFAADVLVGVVAPLSGPVATAGQSMRNGIEMATEELNKTGGVRGQKIKLLALDDQGKPEEAATAVTRLIQNDHVVAVLGNLTSSSSLAMGPIAQTHQTPMISPASTNPRVTQLGDFIFRVCYVDPFQGTVMAQFVLVNLKLKRAAILNDATSDYSVGLAQYFRKNFKRLGGEIVSEQTYKGGDFDFKAQLTSIRAKKPDFIYLPGYYSDVGLMIRQAREIGITQPFGGGDGWDSPKLFEIGGKAMDGSYFSNHYSPDMKSPQLAAFIENYRKKYGSVPDGLAALGYDSALVLFDSMKRSRDLSGLLLRNAIATISNFKGITGAIRFDDKRNPIKSAVILKIQNGRAVYQTTVNP